MTLDSINSADPSNPSVQEVPYTGVQFVAIPEFSGIATQTGQQFSDALAGNQTADEALANAQSIVTEEMEAAGY
jgi:sorbitol/mannitol transport system substrate-binding protein